MLEDFLGSSQFLVVTHARRTMSYADTLYGITMQEHGVSKALSLTLREYDAKREGEAADGPSSPSVPRAKVASALGPAEAAAGN